MFIVDPETPAQPDETPTDLATDALAAMDEGIAAATPDEPAAPEGEAPEGEAPADEAADPPEGAEPEAPKAEEPAPEARPSDEFGELPKDAKAETRERFDKLRTAYDDLHKTLKAAGIEDVKALPQVIERAKMGEDMVAMVMETGASTEQYGMALDYLGLVNRASNGDMVAAQQAFDVMTKEVAALGKLLGKKVDGIVDPLDGHDDLRDEVEAGDLTAARAAEIAATRNRKALEDARTTATTTQQTEQQAAEKAQAEGVKWLVAFDTAAKAQDPHYAAKRPILDSLATTIRATLPPEKWPEAIKRAYQSIPNPAPAPVASTPRPGPMRPSGPRPAMAPETDDPLAALDFGIAQASA